MKNGALKQQLNIAMLEYIEAIANNDISRLHLASDIKYSVNGVFSKMASSEVWGTPRRIPYRQTFVDVKTNSVVFFGIITNTTSEHVGTQMKWWLYAVRLKIRETEIIEIEEIVSDYIFPHYEKMPWEISPDNSFHQVLPEDERSSEESLIEIVNAYWDAVERKIDGYHLPVHPDAMRIECGTRTTDAKNFRNSVRGDFLQRNNEGWRWEVRKRRFPIVDVERGVVVSFADLSMTEMTNPKFMPCIVAEAFKVECGLIKKLNAFFYVGTNQSEW